MTWNDYINGFILLVLVWGVDPAIGALAKELSEHNIGNYLGSFREVLSTLTTLIIFITAIIKYKKEKKQK